MSKKRLITLSKKSTQTKSLIKPKPKSNYSTPQPTFNKISKTYKKQCTICMEEIVKIGRTNCGHEFCFMCLYNWLKKSKTCPICRCQIHNISFTIGNTNHLYIILDIIPSSTCFICDIQRDFLFTGKLNKCSCGRYYHEKCDKLAALCKNITQTSKCGKCITFELDIYSIDNYNDKIHIDDDISTELSLEDRDMLM